MSSLDDIGNRGENLFRVLITAYCGRKRPYFRETFLGEKFKALDFMVHLVGVRSGLPYFFVQVKTTTTGYSSGKSGKRLRVKVTPRDVQRLKGIPAPTYVVGIDMKSGEGYLASIHERLS